MATNDGGHVTQIVFGSNSDEQQALDDLGPLTRAALNDSPIRWSALAIMAQIRELEEQRRKRVPPEMHFMCRIDPRDPKLDRMLSAGLMSRSRETIELDRSPEDAALGIKPLVPRRTMRDLRVVRSERAADRRARRFYR